MAKNKNFTWMILILCSALNSESAVQEESTASSIKGE